ncbi:MAG: putative porin [Phycisphaerae bacterium]
MGLAVWLATPAPTATCRAEPPETEQADRPAAAAQGEQDPDVRQAKLNALEKLNAALRNEPNLSPEFKEAFGELLSALREETTLVSPQVQREELKNEVLASLATQNVERDRVLDAVGDVFEKLNLYGDLRLRHETDNNVDRRPTRNRERLRFRLGAIYQLSDELDIGARIVTGNAIDPKSSHQNFGSGFESFEVTLDRAYATYRPQEVPGLSITGGKFRHPFRMNPVYGELVWDADIQPEGVSVSYTLANGKLKLFDRLGFAIGEYLVLQQNELDEASLFVAQVSGEKGLTSNLDLLAALGWYHYSDLTPDGGLAFRLKNAGNAIEGDEFVSRFSILNPIVALTYKGLPKPLTLSGEFMFNTRAVRGRGEGWAGGLSYGETRKTRDWRVYYQFHYIERDAILSAVSQDDFTLATNFRGHVFGAQYKLSDSVVLHLWALLAERLSSDAFLLGKSGDDQWRFRLDFNIRF